MLQSLKAKLTGGEDEQNEIEDEIGDPTNIDDLDWGERPGPDELPSGADAAVTQVSASSAQLLSKGGRVGSAYCKVMYIPRGGWPTNPKPGMLDRLTAHSSAGVQVKHRVEPMNRDRAASEFKRRLKRKQKELYAKRQSGAPDAGTVEDEKRDLELTLRAIEGGRESIYWVGVYFVVRSRTKEQVEDAVGEIAQSLQKDDLDVTTPDWETKDGLTTVSPVGKRALPDRTMTPMTGSALQCLFPFSTSSMIEESGVLYGYHGLNGSPITVDRFNRENGYNQLVIGNIGAGKSFGYKLLLLRRLVRDRDIQATLVDPRGEFRELVDALGIDAETVEVGGTKGINPLQIEPTPTEVLEERPDMDPRGEKVRSVLAFFEALHADDDGNSGLDAQSKAVLSRATTQAYTDAGITKDPATHSRDSPLPEDVDRVLGEYSRDATTALGEDASERELEKWADRAADLRMAMQPFRDGGRYDHLNQPTNIGLGRDGKRIVLLDIKGSEGSDKMPLDMKLAFDAIYERAKQPGRMIAAFDEAHKIMNSPGGLSWAADGTRYSRHFLLSLVFISQTAEDFFYTTDEEGKTHINTKAKLIADNCSMKWLFRTRGLDDDLGDLLNLTTAQTSFVANATPGDRQRGYSHSLLWVDDLGAVPIRVEAINETEEHAIDHPEPTPTDDSDGEGGDGIRDVGERGGVATDGGER
jgi:hypothetical protein